MAKARIANKIQSKVGALIYGEAFTGKSTLASQFAYFKNPETGKPFRVLYIDCENGSIDDYIENIDGFFIYLDPPYKENNKIGLYGDKGELHKNFNHDMLFEWVQNHSKNNKIMISYDESSYIRNLYKNYNIYSFDFVYSMTNVGGKICKKGGEIVITNYDIDMCPF